MKTMFGLYQKTVRDYNENLWIQKNDPDVVECLGLRYLLDCQYDIKLKMSTIEECAETFGTTYSYQKDKNGYIIKVSSSTACSRAAAAYNFELGEFVAVPCEPT